MTQSLLYPKNKNKIPCPVLSCHYYSTDSVHNNRKNNRNRPAVLRHDCLCCCCITALSVAFSHPSFIGSVQLWAHAVNMQQCRTSHSRKRSFKEKECLGSKAIWKVCVQ